MRVPFIVVVATCIATISCSGNSTTATSSKLTRPAALKLVEAYSKSAENQFRPVWAVGIASAVGYYSGPGANKWKPVVESNHEFYDQLVKMRVVEQEPTCNSHVPKKDFRFDCFHAIGPYAYMNKEKQVDRGSDQDHNIRLRMSSITKEEVTGIAEEASHTSATVEVEIDFGPTPILKPFMELLKTLHAKYPMSMGLAIYSQWASIQQVSAEDLTVKETIDFTFKKFDDGWRVTKWVPA